MHMYFLPSNLTSLRDKFGYTQSYVADKMDVRPNTISNWEKGISKPDIEEIQQLADLFNVSLDDIVAKDLRIVEILNMVTEPTVRYETSRNLKNKVDIIMIAEQIEQLTTILKQKLA